jgi:hypothetical protein
MSELIKKFLQRLRAQKLISRSDTPDDEGFAQNRPSNSSKGGLGVLPLQNWHLLQAMGRTKLKPSILANGLSYSLMLLTAASLTYWAMRIAQSPGPPTENTSSIAKGATLYMNQDSALANDLFGSKPLATENIFLRGVVVTAKNADGKLDGYAIFEIDGKSTNAVSVGENLGKGLSLFGIGDESATLLYQGQQLQFKLYQKKTQQSSKKTSSASSPRKNK